jgi:hypothetical protein
MSDSGRIISMFICDHCRKKVEQALNIWQQQAS